MRLHEPPHIPVRSLLALLALIHTLAEALVLFRVFPRFARESHDSRVERREDRGVAQRVFEAGRQGGEVARETCEDVDAAVVADDVRERH